MATATLTDKGQITIPGAIRKLLGLLPRQKVLFVPHDGKVELVPLKENLMDLYGTFHSKEVEPVEDWAEIRKVVKKKVASKRVKNR